eukprot:36150-Rhodomonas_salina.3
MKTVTTEAPTGEAGMRMVNSTCWLSPANPLTSTLVTVASSSFPPGNRTTTKMSFSSRTGKLSITTMKDAPPDERPVDGSAPSTMVGTGKSASAMQYVSRSQTEFVRDQATRRALPARPRISARSLDHDRECDDRRAIWPSDDPFHSTVNVECRHFDLDVPDDRPVGLDGRPRFHDGHLVPVDDDDKRSLGCGVEADELQEHRASAVDNLRRSGVVEDGSRRAVQPSERGRELESVVGDRHHALLRRVLRRQSHCDGCLVERIHCHRLHCQRRTIHRDCELTRDSTWQRVLDKEVQDSSASCALLDGHDHNRVGRAFFARVDHNLGLARRSARERDDDFGPAFVAHDDLVLVWAELLSVNHDRNRALELGHWEVADDDGDGIAPCHHRLVSRLRDHHRVRGLESEEELDLLGREVDVLHPHALGASLGPRRCVEADHGLSGIGAEERGVPGGRDGQAFAEQDDDLTLDVDRWEVCQREVDPGAAGHGPG